MFFSSPYQPAPMGFNSELDLHAELNRPRLIALCGGLAEGRATGPVRIGFAENRPVGDVTELNLEPVSDTLAEPGLLEDTDIFTHSCDDAANRSVGSDGVAE